MRHPHSLWVSRSFIPIPALMKVFATSAPSFASAFSLERHLKKCAPGSAPGWRSLPVRRALYLIVQY